MNIERVRENQDPLPEILDTIAFLNELTVQVKHGGVNVTIIYIEMT